MDLILAIEVKGMNGKSIAYVLDTLHKKYNVCTFIIGGAIRDTVMAVCNRITVPPCKDVDIGFCCSASEIEKICNNESWPVHTRFTGRVDIGKNDSVTRGIILEGKSINSYNNDVRRVSSSVPACIGSDLFVENIFRDFTIGSIWYDPVNKVIIDPTGHGIEDTLQMKLRIPVDKSMWNNWVLGNPSKLMRYFKHRANGYTVIDQATEDFIIKCIKNGCNGKTFSADDMYCSTTLSRSINVGKDAAQKKKNFKDVLEKSLGTAKVQELFGNTLN
jgi:hypothetical protein